MAKRSRPPQIRRILVPTDFSPLGNRAAAYAYALLPKGGEVCLVHVLEVRPTPSPLYAHYEAGPALTPKRRAALVSSARRRLQRLIPRRAAARGIASVVEVVEATDVNRALCEVAQRRGVDVICMSSHGRSGLSVLLVGSVARALMRRAPAPLLVVRPPAR